MKRLILFPLFIAACLSAVANGPPPKWGFLGEDADLLQTITQSDEAVLACVYRVEFLDLRANFATVNLHATVSRIFQGKLKPDARIIIRLPIDDVPQDATEREKRFSRLRENDVGSLRFCFLRRSKLDGSTYDSEWLCVPRFTTEMDAFMEDFRSRAPSVAETRFEEGPMKRKAGQADRDPRADDHASSLLFMSEFGGLESPTGSWSIHVSAADRKLKISRKTALGGAGVSPAAWRAYQGWFVCVENEERVWAYDGSGDLIVVEMKPGENTVYDISHISFPVPEPIYLRLSEVARQKLRESAGGRLKGVAAAREEWVEALAASSAMREWAAMAYQAAIDHGIGHHEPIPSNFWPSLRQLKPVAVYMDRGNIAVALDRDEIQENGLYVSLTHSSFAPQTGGDWVFVPLKNGALRYNRRLHPAPQANFTTTPGAEGRPTEAR